MKSKIWIGADNGVTASWGIVGDIEPMFFKVPVFKQLSFQKTKPKNINRINTEALYEVLKPLCERYTIKAFLERPMVNSARFSASLSAVRALEATLIVFELLAIPYDYIDSKSWQKALLPKGTSGSEMLKSASKDVGIRLFPQYKVLINKHKDADGILIAEYARRNEL
jgi:hypothetical protein